MAEDRPDILVTDTSVLINFLAIDRMDLIGGHPSRFLATDHVAAEITDHFPEQQERYQAAVAANHVVEVSVATPQEVDLFGQLASTRQLGTGECSAIALAICQRHRLAIDDRRARNQALAIQRELQVVSTQDLVVEMIQADLLDVATANAIKTDWHNNHSFTLKLDSFAELL